LPINLKTKGIGSRGIRVPVNFNSPIQTERFVITMQNASPPSLLLKRANVITMDPSLPYAEAVFVKDGRVRLVGTGKGLHEARSAGCRVIDCGGRTVLPGFIDAHFHLQAFAESLVNVNVSPDNGVCFIADIQTTLKKHSLSVPRGDWIRAGGYNEFYLNDNRHPNRWDLDQAVPDHPVKLIHRSGHAHVLNSLALEMTGISIETPDPPGGLIERDIQSGEPNGQLFGMGGWLSDKIPPLDDKLLDEGIDRANQALISAGISAIHDASFRNDPKRCRRFQRWKAEGRLASRVSMMMGLSHTKLEPEDRQAFPPTENGIPVRGVKIMVDQTRGRLNPGRKELNEMVLAVHKSGRQVAIHAIEQSSVEAACAAVELALKRYPEKDHRHRIEHCSECPPALARKLAELGIVVVTQPAFLYFHGQRYLETLTPHQLQHLYPTGTLFRNGVLTAAGSDCPIVSANPLLGVYAAVSRRTQSDETILPQERVSPLDALKMHTIHAAQACFREADFGSIEAGKKADLVVLDDDPTRLPIEKIKDIRVDMTIIDGEVVWERTPDQQPPAMRATGD